MLHTVYTNPISLKKRMRHFSVKCNNPYYHGHNYELIVGVTGEVDPKTGYLIDMKVLADLIKTEVEDYMDHKNLNEQVAEFKNTKPYC